MKRTFKQAKMLARLEAFITAHPDETIANTAAALKLSPATVGRYAPILREKLGLDPLPLGPRKPSRKRASVKARRALKALGEALNALGEGQ